MRILWRRFFRRFPRRPLTAEDHASLARSRERLIRAMYDYQKSHIVGAPVEIFLGTRVFDDSREEIDTMLAAFLGRRAATCLKERA